MKFFLLAFSLSFVISAPVSVGAEPGYDPKALEALIDEGNSKLLAGKTKAACRSFEKAVKLSAGQSYNAQLGWATALLKAKEPEAALAPAAAAERLSTNDKMRSTAAFLSGLAQYQNRPNDPVALAKAATSLEKAIELAPERTAQARVTLGYVYRALGQFEPHNPPAQRHTFPGDGEPHAPGGEDPSLYDSLRKAGIAHRPFPSHAY